LVQRRALARKARYSQLWSKGDGAQLAAFLIVLGVKLGVFGQGDGARLAAFFYV